jgi:hypothetical protein
MGSFTFKRGLVRSAETWEVSENQLSQSGGENIDFATLIGIQFSDVPAGRLMVTELILETDRGKVRLQCNDGRRGESRRQFLAMCRAVATELNQSRTDIRFTPTLGSQFLGWSIAGMGVAAIVWGLYFIVTCLMSLEDQGAGFGIGMGTFACLFGLFLIWCGSPWVKPEPQTPAETIAWIDRISMTG